MAAAVEYLDYEGKPPIAILPICTFVLLLNILLHCLRNRESCTKIRKNLGMSDQADYIYK